MRTNVATLDKYANQVVLTGTFANDAFLTCPTPHIEIELVNVKNTMIIYGIFSLNQLQFGGGVDVVSTDD